MVAGYWQLIEEGMVPTDAASAARFPLNISPHTDHRVHITEGSQEHSHGAEGITGQIAD